MFKAADPVKVSTELLANEDVFRNLMSLLEGATLVEAGNDYAVVCGEHVINVPLHGRTGNLNTFICLAISLVNHAHIMSDSIKINMEDTEYDLEHQS